MQMWRPMRIHMLKDTNRIFGMSRVSLQEENQGKKKRKKKDLDERKTKQSVAAHGVPCKSTCEVTVLSYLMLREPVGNHDY